MKSLSEPSATLARQALMEVDFDDRLIGYWHRERQGVLTITMYDFEEVLAFFSDSLPEIDFAKLEIWVRDVIGDQELAGRIQETRRLDLAPLPKGNTIAQLMFARLIQYKRVLSLVG